MKKTHIFRTLALAAALFVCSYSANAQFEFSLFFAGGLPQGKDITAKLPQAANGTYGNYMGMMGKQYIMNQSTPFLGGGFRFGYRIAINNSEAGEILPFVEVQGLWNRPASDIRKQYKQNNDDYSNYINAPLYIGAQYRYPVTDIIKPYAEFGLGYDLLFITSEYGKDNGESLRYGSKRDDYCYKTEGAFSWQLGAGCFFSDYVSVGLYYYGLGTHSINYKNLGETYNNSNETLYNPYDENAGTRIYALDNSSIHALVADPTDIGSDGTTSTGVASLGKAVTRSYGMFALRLNFHFGPSRR